MKEGGAGGGGGGRLESRRDLSTWSFNHMTHIYTDGSRLKEEAQGGSGCTAPEGGAGGGGARAPESNHGNINEFLLQQLQGSLPSVASDQTQFPAA